MIRRALRSSISIVPWRLRTLVKNVPILAGLQRTLLSTYLNGNEFTHRIDRGPARGLRYPILFPDDKNIWTGTYELPFVEAIAAAVQPGDVCLDVGGYRGYCAGVMAVRGAGKVVTFEPLPANVVRIRRLKELNPELDIELVEAAVGEREATVDFEVMEAASMGKLMASSFQHDRKGVEHIKVPLISLDAWSDSRDGLAPGVIKIDVEGAELAVIQGAQRLIDRARPQLFIEAHSRELTRGVTDALRSHGYRVTIVGTDLEPDGRTEPVVCHLSAVALA